ncbi:eukaryotic DNA topoisomerase I, catalytic core [Bordetella bronchiseptica E010]|nr:eukaryotic DNA topoisomerase I, catalytic core [Bordetella bronchiseptica E010]
MSPAAPAALRYVDDSRPGLARRRLPGGKFAYYDANGRRVRDPGTLARIAALAIPPAYREVWICARADGHLQATGRDARGRKQYRYHPDWRAWRDAAKYGQLREFGRALPRIRRRVARDLSSRGLAPDKVAATVVRLLETTLARVGSRAYARENGSFGLTTVTRRHAWLQGSRLRLRFTGKSGVAHDVTVRDRRIARVVKRCLDLPGQQLFHYLDEDGEPRPVDSELINAYLRETVPAVAGRARRRARHLRRRDRAPARAARHGFRRPVPAAHPPHRPVAAQGPQQRAAGRRRRFHRQALPDLGRLRAGACAAGALAGHGRRGAPRGRGRGRQAGGRPPGQHAGGVPRLLHPSRHRPGLPGRRLAGGRRRAGRAARAGRRRTPPAGLRGGLAALRRSMSARSWRVAAAPHHRPSWTRSGCPPPARACPPARAPAAWAAGWAPAPGRAAAAPWLDRVTDHRARRRRARVWAWTSCTSRKRLRTVHGSGRRGAPPSRLVSICKQV